MNTTLDTSNKPDIKQNLEENFNTAVNLSSKEYSYQDLITLLQSDKISEKQFAALELKEIQSNEDAQILVSNLVGQDGKIREAVAFKINELTKTKAFRAFFLNETSFDTFLKGIMDINGNVCRQIVDLTSIYEFKEYLSKNLPKSISKVLEVIKELDKNDKQYKISKRNFQLYWCLEALYNVIELVNIDDVKDFILQTGEFEDYTIREKTAKILSKLNNTELYELQEKLKNDENYYVKRYLN